MRFQQFLLAAPLILFSMVAHEYAHGWVALKNGDPTAYQLGRLTWNPIKHIDPFMTILLPLMLFFTSGDHPWRGEAGSREPAQLSATTSSGDIIVSLAGVDDQRHPRFRCSLSSIPLFYGLARLFPAGEHWARDLPADVHLRHLDQPAARAFNLIPIPPLDGSHVFKYLLPPAWALAYQRLNQFGLIIIYAVLFFAGSVLDLVAHAGDPAARVARPHGRRVRDTDAHGAVLIAVSETEIANSDDANAFVVELPEFSGPLDLLLSLIRDEQVDIYDIPIARIAEQFLLRVRTMRIDTAAEYLEMAARLLRIKAQMLLPRHDGVTIGKIRARSSCAAFSNTNRCVRSSTFSKRSATRVAIGSRASYVQEQGEPDAESERPLAASLSDLFAAVDRVLRHTQATVRARRDSARARRRRRDHRDTRSARAARTRTLVRSRADAAAEPWQILSVLLALLELAKRGELRIAQPKPFAAVEFNRDAASEAS